MTVDGIEPLNLQFGNSTTEPQLPHQFTAHKLINSQSTYCTSRVLTQHSKTFTFKVENRGDGRTWEIDM